MIITEKEIAEIKAFRRELYRDESEGPEKLAGLFARGHYSIVASPAGTGKTWLTLLLMCQLSNGEQTFTGLNHRITPAKVLLMVGETGVDMLRQRLNLTAWGYNSENISMYSAVEFAKKGKPYLLNTPEGQQTFIKVIYAEKPDIVFIDTLVSWHNVDVIKQSEMTAVYTFLLRIADAFKCAVVINHHTRKRSSNTSIRDFDQDDVMGTSVGTQLARDVYILIPQKDKSVNIKHMKSWDKKVPTMNFRIIHDGFYTDLAFNDVTQSGDTPNRFEEYYAQLPLTGHITVKQTAEYLQISEQLCRYYINSYVKSGKLVEQKMGAYKAYVKPGSNSKKSVEGA